MKARAVFVLAVGIASAAACLSRPPVPVRLEMPGVSPFPAGLFRELIVTNFRDDAPSQDFALSREFQTYLVAELGRSFKGTVSRADVSWGDEAAGNDPAFWRRTAAGRGGAIFITGTASLAGQVRKALENKKLPVDGPFKMDGRGLIEQRHWTLSVDLNIVSAATGEPIYKKTLREERDYIDLDKPADFAFSELVDRVRDRLLSLLLGKATTEERTLLRR